MLKGIIKLVIYIFVAYTSELIIYKMIKKIDKKERKKMQTWENNYIDSEIEKINKNNLNYKTTKRNKTKNDRDTNISNNTDN